MKNRKKPTRDDAHKIQCLISIISFFLIFVFALVISAKALTILFVDYNVERNEELVEQKIVKPTPEAILVIENIKPLDNGTNEPILPPSEPESAPEIERPYSDVELSDSDIELIAKVVYLEARGESAEGQAAVVEVILNRVLDSRFPSTVSEVIYAQGQFAVVGQLDSAVPTQAQYDAIKTALTETRTDGAIYFATSPLTSNITVHIGGHYFCK